MKMVQHQIAQFMKFGGLRLFFAPHLLPLLICQRCYLWEWEFRKKLDNLWMIVRQWIGLR
jgi:hypothetical protein